jgi:hypothetical protein
MCQASNYRPITLPNSDYKVLARVLADRFGKVMPACIGVEQTAHLPGREIGDGVFHTQLAAANLALLGPRGAVVLLDIAKAFDTIDRAFLLATIERCGGGPGMRRCMHLLLQHTPASVVVRGRAAAPVLWLASVRQGCPLSPLLYLYVAEASARWLRADCALGILLAGRRIVSSQHADDTKVARALLRTSVLGSS